MEQVASRSLSLPAGLVVVYIVELGAVTKGERGKAASVVVVCPCPCPCRLRRSCSRSRSRSSSSSPNKYQSQAIKTMSKHKNCLSLFVKGGRGGAGSPAAPLSIRHGACCCCCYPLLPAPPHDGSPQPSRSEGTEVDYYWCASSSGCLLACMAAAIGQRVRTACISFAPIPARLTASCFGLWCGTGRRRGAREVARLWRVVPWAVACFSLRLVPPLPPHPNWPAGRTRRTFQVFDTGVVCSE